MREDSDGRECARGRHCLRYWYDAAGEARGAWGPRTLCDPCRGRLADAIAELPELYAWLWLQLPSSSLPPDARATAVRGRTAPIPLRGDVDALMRDLYDVAASWEERVRDVAHLPDRHRGIHPHGPALTEITRTLQTHVDALLALQPQPMIRRGDDGTIIEWLDGATAAEEILRLHAQARRMAGHTRQVTTLPGVPCPQCDLCALVTVSGEANPHCRGCGANLPEEDYRRWTRHLAHEAQYLHHGS